MMWDIGAWCLESQLTGKSSFPHHKWRATVCFLSLSVSLSLQRGKSPNQEFGVWLNRYEIDLEQEPKHCNCGCFRLDSAISAKSISCYRSNLSQALYKILQVKRFLRILKETTLNFFLFQLLTKLDTNKISILKDMSQEIDEGWKA